MKNLLILGLSFTLLSPIQAQTTESKQRTNPPEGKTAGEARTKEKAELSSLQKRAIDIIDQLSQTAKQIDDDIVKTRVRTLIADTLWEYNKDQSRKLFEEAFEATCSLAEQQPGKAAVRIKLSSPEHVLHSFVLRLISRRDPDLVEKLQQKGPQIEFYIGPRVIPSEPLMTAREIAASNPEQAAQIVEKSLTVGIDPVIGNILIDIHAKAPALADKLFLRALTIARSEPSFNTSTLSGLAIYAIPSWGGRDLEFRSALNGIGLKEANPALATSFLEYAYDMILKRAAVTQQNSGGNADQRAQAQSASEYNLIQKLLPYFMQYLPDKAGVVRAHLAHIGQGPPEELIKRVMDPLGASELESLLEKANKAKTPTEADKLYERAASIYLSKGNEEEAVSTASRIVDEANRSRVESNMRYQIALSAASKGDIDRAYRYARDISFTGEYGLAFRAILQTLSRQKDKQKAEEIKQRAMEMISEAERFLIRADNGGWKARALLLITEAAVPIDPSRAFDVIQLAVKALNDTDFDDRKPIYLGSRQIFSVTVEAINFEATLPALAKSDPDRALLLAKSLVRKELNIQAQLAVCQGMLAKKEEAENAPAPPGKETQKKKSRSVQKNDNETSATAPGKKGNH